MSTLESAKSSSALPSDPEPPTIATVATAEATPWSQALSRQSDGKVDHDDAATTYSVDTSREPDNHDGEHGCTLLKHMRVDEITCSHVRLINRPRTSCWTIA